MSEGVKETAIKTGVLVVLLVVLLVGLRLLGGAITRLAGRLPISILSADEFITQLRPYCCLGVERLLAPFSSAILPPTPRSSFNSADFVRIPPPLSISFSRIDIRVYKPMIQSTKSFRIYVSFLFWNLSVETLKYICVFLGTGKKSPEKRFLEKRSPEKINLRIKSLRENGWGSKFRKTKCRTTDISKFKIADEGQNFKQ